MIMTTPKNETLATLRITTTRDVSADLFLRGIARSSLGANVEIAHHIVINDVGIPSTLSDLDHEGQHPYWPLSYHQATHHCDEDGFVTVVLTVSQEKWRETIEAWALGYDESETDLCHNMVFDFGEPTDASATIIGVRENTDDGGPCLVVMYNTLIADPDTVTDAPVTDPTANTTAPTDPTDPTQE